MAKRRVSPETQALLWHVVATAWEIFGLVGHFWLRRQRARLENRNA